MEIVGSFLESEDSGERGRVEGAVAPVPFIMSVCSRVFPIMLRADATSIVYVMEEDRDWVVFTVATTRSGSLTITSFIPTVFPETSSRREISTGSWASASLKVISTVLSSRKSIFCTENPDKVVFVSAVEAEKAGADGKKRNHPMAMLHTRERREFFVENIRREY